MGRPLHSNDRAAFNGNLEMGIDNSETDLKAGALRLVCAALI